MGKELIEKCLLTTQEILNAMNKNPFDCAKHISLADGCRDELVEISKAQLIKATPIIRGVVADEIKKGLEEFLKFSTHFTTINHPNEWQTFWEKYLKE